MGKIDFKSVGELDSDVKKRKKDDDSFLAFNKPVGIKTPLRLGVGSDGIFGMNFSLSEQIRDNLRNLLLTNWGERVGLYDFGANLRELTHELTSQKFDIEAPSRIKRAIGKYMPYVFLQTMETESEHDDNENIGKVKMRITYDIPLLKEFNRIIEVIFFVTG